MRGRRGVSARRGGRASREAVDLALLALNNSVLLTIPAERLDVDGYATLETLLPTYFRGLRQAAPPRPPFQRRDRSQGAAARALRRLCDADQQIFDAAALIYQRRARVAAAAREYEHAVELRHARLALNRRRERQGLAEAATLRPSRSGGGPTDRRGRHLGPRARLARRAPRGLVRGVTRAVGSSICSRCRLPAVSYVGHGAPADLRSGTEEAAPSALLTRPAVAVSPDDRLTRGPRRRGPAAAGRDARQAQRGRSNSARKRRSPVQERRQRVRQRVA